jgi:serine/threonine protein kinase
MNMASGEPAEVPPNPFPNLPHKFGGKYVLKRRIGSGGVGVVYEAEEPKLERTVAIKVPLQGANCFNEVRKFFGREARLLSRFAQLATANICQVYDADEVDRCPFIAMEYIPGQTLTDYWKQNRKPLGPSGAADLICNIARIVGRVHKFRYRDEKIIHRDLKPGNILMSAVPGEAEPRVVLLDFGFAFNIAPGHPLATKDVAGTVGYMPPEQLNFGWEGCEISERSDVYSLGVVLYQLLTNEMPFDGDTFYSLADKVMRTAAPEPSLKHPVYAPFDPICKKAMARHPKNRYASMEEFADALVDALIELQSPRKASSTKGARMTSQPAIPPDSIHYAFVPMGYTAPQSLMGLDRLFLDVGNRLTEGVIDHHQKDGGPGPTARLVRDRPELIDAALSPTRDPGDPFTIVMHQYPDLDAVSAAALAVKHLTTRAFPAQADALIRYVERSDAGESCVGPQQPFTLYSAFMRLVSRNLADAALAPQERWRKTVQDGIALINFTLGEVEKTKMPLDAVDPFTASIFTRDDRDAVFSDANRYKAKLAAPETNARRCRLRFPGRAGGEVAVEGLIVRDVQNATDPKRVAFFKDWARGDVAHSRDAQGFAALSVFMPEEAGHKRRCILSVTPGCGASLAGLGKLLDEAEAARRVQLHGVDDRNADPVTGELLPPRPGYGNSDPWYDGRGHEYTIVDSPRSGTVLTADEIEKIFLDFGRATDVESVKVA